jgi:hypothetical protein
MTLFINKTTGNLKHKRHESNKNTEVECIIANILHTQNNRDTEK